MNEIAACRRTGISQFCTLSPDASYKQADRRRCWRRTLATHAYKLHLLYLLHVRSTTIYNQSRSTLASLGGVTESAERSSLADSRLL